MTKTIVMILAGLLAAAGGGYAVYELGLTEGRVQGGKERDAVMASAAKVLEACYVCAPSCRPLDGETEE